MTTYSIRELIARLQDLADDGYKTLTDAELDKVVLGRDAGLSVGDAVFVNDDGDEFSAVIVSFNDDDTVTVRSEMTGRKYTVSKGDIRAEDETNPYLLTGDELARTEARRISGIGW